MPTKERQHVALTKCFYCGGSNELLLATRYYRDANGHMQPAKDLAPLNGAVVSQRPYQECEGFMKQGLIVISTRDGETGDNPYRTGGFWVLKDEAIERIFGKAAEPVLKRRCCFMENSMAKQLGFPNAEGLAQ